MNYNIYDVITFEDNTKMIILDIVNYEGINYLYVDEIDEQEENTLKKYQILRECSNNTLEKEVDKEVLTNILKLIAKN